MPASPEFGRALGGIGIVEVSRVVETHHLTKTDGHVGISREVEVNLEGVGGHARKAAYEADLCGLAGEERVGEDARCVGKEHLLTQPYAEEPEALCEAFERDFAVVDFVFDVGVADDGTGDKLREHGDVHAQVKRVSLRLDLAAVDVDDVGDRLQGEERDADGQRQVELRDELLANRAVYIVGEEALVLVEAEDGKVEDQVKDEQQLL